MGSQSQIDAMSRRIEELVKRIARLEGDNIQLRADIAKLGEGLAGPSFATRYPSIRPVAICSAVR